VVVPLGQITNAMSVDSVLERLNNYNASKPSDCFIGADGVMYRQVTMNIPVPKLDQVVKIKTDNTSSGVHSYRVTKIESDNSIIVTEGTNDFGGKNDTRLKLVMGGWKADYGFESELEITFH
jgi:hypothetical protein